MIFLVIGLIVFFSMHSISIVNEPWRNSLEAKFGAAGWKGIYSVISLAGFVAICWGYGVARQDPVVLYSPPAWAHYVVILLMLGVFPLFLAANLPGRIKSAAKHPLLAATKLWALAHLLANGTLADVLLFGSFLAWAVADRVSMKHRTQRRIMSAPATPFNDIAAVVVGLVIYALFVVWGHEALFGVPLI